MAKYRNESVGDVTGVFKALGDESRTRIIMALTEGELCVCRVISLLNLAPSTVSKHLQILKSAGLIECRKNGRWIYYRLAGDGVVAELMEFVKRTLREDEVLKEDRKRLKDLMKEDPEQICKRI